MTTQRWPGPLPDHGRFDYRPITRYDVVGGYLNIPGLAKQPDRYPIEEDTP